MKISEKNIFTKTKRGNNKNRRWVAFSLAGLLASGAAVATSIVIASEGRSNNANTNINNSTNHELDELAQTFGLAQAGGVLATPLTEDERNNFQQAIEAIQSDINDKLAQASLELTVNDFKLDPITEEKETSYADARADFANDLGIKGEVANELFTAIDAFLDSDLFSSTTHSLRDGLSFLYTRSGLRRDGTAVGRLRAIYRTNGERPITPLTEHAFALSITVTGINVTAHAKNAVDAELRRLSDLNLTGAVKTAMQNATNDIVTDFTPFGIDNTKFDFNKFNYLVSHSPILSSGSYEMVLKVTTKSNATIVSSALNIRINADIPGVPTSSDNSNGDKGDGKTGQYVIWGVAGALGIVPLGASIFYGAKAVQSLIHKIRRTNGSGSHSGEFMEMSEISDRTSVGSGGGDSHIAGSAAPEQVVDQGSGTSLEAIASTSRGRLTSQPLGIIKTVSLPALTSTHSPVVDVDLGLGSSQEGFFINSPIYQGAPFQERPLPPHPQQPLLESELGQRFTSSEPAPEAPILSERGAFLGPNTPQEIAEESAAFRQRLLGRVALDVQPEDFMATIAGRLSAFSAQLEAQGGITALKGFSLLTEEAQQRALAFLKDLPATVSGDAVDATVIRQFFTREVTDISLEILALHQAGSLTAEESADFMRALGGRFMSSAQEAGFTPVEALASLDAELLGREIGSGVVEGAGEVAFGEGAISFLEHLLLF